MITSEQPMVPAFLEAGSASIDDFDKLDIRVGRVLSASPLEGARIQPTA